MGSPLLDGDAAADCEDNSNRRVSFIILMAKKRRPCKTYSCLPYPREQPLDQLTKKLAKSFNNNKWSLYLNKQRQVNQEEHEIISEPIPVFYWDKEFEKNCHISYDMQETQNNCENNADLIQ